MKILFWTPLYWPEIGSIEISSERLLRGLKDRDCRCIVLTAHGKLSLPDETQHNGIPVYRFPITSALKTNKLDKIRHIQNRVISIMESFQPDIIHVNFGGPATVSYFYLKTADAVQAASLVTFHNSVGKLSSAPETILGQVLRKADWITACSQAMLDDARMRMPDILSRSSIVYYGLDKPRQEPAPLSFDEPRILCLGRLVEEKGFDLAVDAFAILKKKFPGLKMEIAGDGPAMCSLAAHVSRLRLSDDIQFTGEFSQKDVPDMINSATFIIVPSRWREAFGLVAIEASLMARPVIAVKTGGLQEAVLDQKTGLLVEKDNSLAIAQAAAFLLDNPGKAREIGESGRLRALEEFSSEKYVDNYYRLYLKLKSEKKFPKKHPLSRSQ